MASAAMNAATDSLLMSALLSEGAGFTGSCEPVPANQMRDTPAPLSRGQRGSGHENHVSRDPSKRQGSIGDLNPAGAEGGHRVAVLVLRPAVSMLEPRAQVGGV